MQLYITLLLTATAAYHQDATLIVGVMIFIVCFLLATYLYVRHRFAREIAYRKSLVHSYEKELDRVTREIDYYKAALKEKEALLEEKIQQNKSYLRLLHQTEIEGSAKDIVSAVRRASQGQYRMEEDDWQALLHAIDELYPTFNDTLSRKLGRIDRQELRVCYLIRIGLSNPQIQNITGLPRTTVWRWVKKNEWILNGDVG